MKIVGLLGWFGSYKVVWLCCVLGGGVYGYPFLGAIPMLLWVVSWLLYCTETRKPLLYTTLFSGAYGLCFDSLLVLSDVMHFAEHAQFGPPSPIWMVVLWLGFGALIEKSFGALYGKWF